MIRDRDRRGRVYSCQNCLQVVGLERFIIILCACRCCAYYGGENGEFGFFIVTKMTTIFWIRDYFIIDKVYKGV